MKINKHVLFLNENTFLKTIILLLLSNFSWHRAAKNIGFKSDIGLPVTIFPAIDYTNNKQTTIILPKNIKLIIFIYLLQHYESVD